MENGSVDAVWYFCNRNNRKLPLEFREKRARPLKFPRVKKFGCVCFCLSYIWPISFSLHRLNPISCQVNFHPIWWFFFSFFFSFNLVGTFLSALNSWAQKCPNNNQIYKHTAKWCRVRARTHNGNNWMVNTLIAWFVLSAARFFSINFFFSFLCSRYLYIYISIFFFDSLFFALFFPRICRHVNFFMQLCPPLPIYTT